MDKEETKEERGKARIRLLKLMFEGVLAAIHMFKDELVASTEDARYMLASHGE